MTNFEFYKDEIRRNGIRMFAVNKETGKPCSCGKVPCSNCKFHDTPKPDMSCDDTLTDWLYEDYKEPPVDWSKVSVDTKILVRDYENDQWFPRHFAKYDEKTSKVFTWLGGGTSWTTTDINSWDYAKLAEENEEYKEPGVEGPKVGWSKVPVDTKILVKCCDTDDWERRYFAKYDKKTNEVYSFAEGATSWSAGSNPIYLSWDYAKLAWENNEK